MPGSQFLLDEIKVQRVTMVASPIREGSLLSATVTIRDGMPNPRMR